MARTRCLVKEPARKESRIQDAAGGVSAWDLSQQDSAVFQYYVFVFRPKA
jgi:hypothetical protein